MSVSFLHVCYVWGANAPKCYPNRGYKVHRGMFVSPYMLAGRGPPVPATGAVLAGTGMVSVNTTRGIPVINPNDDVNSSTLHTCLSKHLYDSQLS
jgi:hypothetical protein